ncbi:hypothetical protein [Hyphomicrobium sp. CS1GBMeth3]|uniref:hypothetical protein n=1 Tax=Hyphomicrobium sp. CS1GBMeth3 TaxID=1892845 RepID=UPI000A76B86E|nr:hypothetical protein [Hyphomicrobium sp. CS1GBMeth3]
MELDKALQGIREPPGSLKERAVQRHLDEWASEDAPSFKVQYAKLLSDLIRRAPERDEIEIEGAVYEAGALVFGFAQACHVETYLTQPLVRPKEIWRHRQVSASVRDGYTSPEYSHGNLEDLAGVAESYIDSEFQSSTFEVLIVDAIIATEITSFAEEIKRSPSRFFKRASMFSLWFDSGEYGRYVMSKGDSGKLMWLTLKDRLRSAIGIIGFLYVLPLALAWLAAEYQYNELAAIIALFVVVVFISRCALRLLRVVKRLLSREADPLTKVSALVGKMTQAYDELRAGEASSPQRVRELLVRAADDGAVWPPVLFSILDRAIQRGQGNWRAA